jgi:type IX secretion system PorP/SprF family membrane protein
MEKKKDSTLPIMKKIYFTAITIIACIAFSHAQQQPHNTQFMYYKQGYNPGFVGSQESTCLSCIYRQQWLGLDGAPSLAVASFNMPLSNQRVGVGANLFRHTIGITSIYNIDGMYAYRIRLGQGMLGIGIQGSIRSMEHDFQRTVATQSKQDDPSIPATTRDKFLFNFGSGMYYTSKRFYFGASVPRLLRNNIDFADSDVVITREIQHLYLMGGLTFPLGEKLMLQPQALLKMVKGAPVDFDANVNLRIVDKYVAGLTYRLGGDKNTGMGESLDILIGAQLTDKLVVGFSYDYSISQIRTYTAGSIEMTAHYCIGAGNAKAKEYVNPRFF